MNAIKINDLEKILSDYSAQLIDTASPEYRFFSIINSLEENNYALFNNVILALKENKFVLNDYFSFVENSQSTINIDSISLFMVIINSGGEKLSKLNSLRKIIFRNSYKEYGNLNAFLKSMFQTIPNNLFFNNVFDDNSELFNNPNKFLLIPKIKYYGNESYSSFKKAEDAYWNIIDLWKTENNIFTLESDYLASLELDSYQTQFGKDVAGFLLYRNYNKTISGVPLLLNKRLQKPLFINIANLDQAITESLQGSYLYLSITEVYNFIDKMLLDIIDWQINFDYNNEAGLPDLRGFAEYKINLLEKENIKEISIEKFKEIKFYTFFITNFVKLNNVNLLQFHNIIQSDFIRLNQLINQVRLELLNKGNFEEY